jgi:hypothetical protein
MNIAIIIPNDEVIYYILANGYTMVVADHNDSWYSRAWMLLP